MNIYFEYIDENQVKTYKCMYESDGSVGSDKLENANRIWVEYDGMFRVIKGIPTNVSDKEILYLKLAAVPFE